MQNAHTILGLAHNASSAEIRSRYLELVREFPPETHPDKAAEIRAAYDALRDPLARLEKQVFEMQTSHTLGSLVDEYSPTVRGKRFPTDLLLSLGRS